MSYAKKKQGPANLGAAFGDGLIAAVEALLIAFGKLLMQPLLSVPLMVFGGVAGGLVWLLGPVGGAIALGVVVALFVVQLVVWRVSRPVSFSRWVGRPARNTWLRLWRYRMWRPVLIGCGVYKRHIGKDGEPTSRLLTPEVLHVEGGEWRDLLLVRLRHGQNPGHLEKEDVIAAIRHEFDALSVRVRVEKPREGSRKEKQTKLWVEVMHDDPLKYEVPPFEIEEVVDLERVPVGIRDTGETWFIKLLGAHQLIVGQMGSGKGSVIWAIIRALAWLIRDGRVQLWGIDPKGGMELGIGRELFARFCADDGKAAARMLEELVAIMKERTTRYGEDKSRKLVVPTVKDPVIVCVIDEILSLLVFAPADVKKRIEAALGLLLTQGRAPGIIIVAATQNPRKDLLKLRDEFNCRVCLAVASDTQPDMVLGEGARDRGARCDDPLVIPKALPGIGFVLIEGEREMARVRACHLRDADIIAMAEEFAPTVTPAGFARAVLEGRGDDLTIPMTPRQVADLERRKAAWAAEDEQDALDEREMAACSGPLIDS